MVVNDGPDIWGGGKIMIMAIVIAVIIICIFIGMFGFYIPSEIEWRGKIMKDLCEKNDMGYDKRNAAFLEHPICYKQENDIRVEYYAPNYWGDFDDPELQYLKRSSV